MNIRKMMRVRLPVTSEEQYHEKKEGKAGRGTPASSPKALLVHLIEAYTREK